MATTASAHSTTPTTSIDQTRWRILSVGLVGAFMVMFDESMMNAILPSMQVSLHMSSSQVVWATAGFSLAGAVCLVPSGRLGDDFGRRRLFVVGMILFVVFTASCALAPNGDWLVASRFAMGLAGAMVIPQVVGLVQQLFAGKERAKAFGVYAALVAASTAFGPLLAGRIIAVAGEHNGWRWVFYAGLPISLAALVLGYLNLPKAQSTRLTKDGTTQHTMRGQDPVGMVLLAAALVCIVLPLAENGDDGVTPPWWTLGVGGVLLVAFLVYERSLDQRGQLPMVRPRLLALPSFFFSFATSLLVYMAFPPILILLQLYFQMGLHYTAWHSSMVTILFPIGSLAGALVGGRLVPRFGRWMVVLGCLMMGAGLAVAASLTTNYDGGSIALMLAPALLVCGLGAGCVISCNQSLGLHDIPRSESSMAGGSYQLGVRIGASIGIPIATSAYFSEVASSHGNFGDAAGSGLLVPTISAFAAAVLAAVGLVVTKQWGSRDALLQDAPGILEEAAPVAPVAPIAPAPLDTRNTSSTRKESTT